MATDISQVQSGWDVYGSDGDKVGDVGDIGPNYILVTKGFLFTKDIYIPTSAITGIEHDRVYLNVAKDQVESMGWDQPPADIGYAAPDRDTSRETYTDQDSTTVTTQTTDTDYVAQPVQTQDYTQSEQVQTQPTSTVSDDDSTRVQRYEEELQAEKTEREAGEVRVSKDVVEEEQTLEVPVQREEVHVESHVVDRPVGDTTDAFQGGTISVPVSEEDVEVRKEPRVAEELEISKEAVQDTERVSDTVRKEDVHVEQAGEVDVEGGSTGTSRSSDTGRY